VALLLTLSPGLALAAPPADPTTEDVARAAMLQARDLQASATGSGITVVDSKDLPGYTENGGLREVRQTWSVGEGGTQVFDFRWQFPDADAAASFLDAAESELSEASSGAEKRSLPATERPLADTRLYTFEDNLFGTGTVGFNFLMSDGNLVAKVYVAGNKGDVTMRTALAIAKAAARRMDDALGATSGPASPGTSESPVPSAGATAALPQTSDDLGAMVPRSSDAEAAGLEDYGDVRVLRRGVWDYLDSGFVALPDVLTHRNLRGIREDAAASLASELEDAGWRGQFRGVLGHSNDGYVDAAVISSVGDYADEDGAASAFGTLTGLIGNDLGAVAAEDAPSIGDEAALINDTTNVLSYETSRSTLIFRSGHYVGTVDVLGPAHDEIPVATVEAVGQRFLDRISAAAASPAMPLSREALALDAPAAHFIERYDVLDGDVLRLWDESDADFATRAATYSASDAFRRDEAIPDGDKALNEVWRFAVYAYRFADPEQASAWLAGVPSRRGLTPIESARTFGDESLTFAEAYEWQGVSRTGYRTYIRVGSTVVAVTIDGPDGGQLDTVESLAELQTECLTAGVCDSAPVPVELLP